MPISNELGFTSEEVSKALGYDEGELVYQFHGGEEFGL